MRHGTASRSGNVVQGIVWFIFSELVDVEMQTMKAIAKSLKASVRGRQFSGFGMHPQE